MTTTTAPVLLTAHQQWNVRRWAISDVIPVLLPLVGITDDDTRTWAGLHPEYAAGRAGRLGKELRSRGRYPDLQADLCEHLAIALHSLHEQDWRVALNTAQRCLSQHSTGDRRDSRPMRQRWETTMDALLAHPEPEVFPVGISEIARIAGVSRDTVDEWTRRHSDFPAPRWRIGARPAWQAADVERWLADTGRSYIPAGSDSTETTRSPERTRVGPLRAA